MDCYKLLQLKSDLLCYGLKIDAHVKDALLQQNRYAWDHDFIHAAHFTIEGTNLNTCISESFCTASPYNIKTKAESFILFKGEEEICPIDIVHTPDWCSVTVDNYEIGQFLRPHSPKCIVCWPILTCDYYRNGTQCKFCSMGNYHNHAILPEHTVISMIKQAVAYDPSYEITLGGGIHNGRDETFTYFSSICKALHDSGIDNISFELAPPDELKNIDMLRESGAKAIIMNLEIADSEKRLAICPEKGKIPVEHYFRAYDRAVHVFGRGNVSCVLLAGIQPRLDIIRMSALLIEHGVIPSILPFKPVDGCQMRTQLTTDPKELVSIALANQQKLIRAGLAASMQPGCTKCNACSLETVAELTATEGL